MKLRAFLAGLLLTVSLLMVACGGSETPTSAPTAIPTPTLAPKHTPPPPASFRLTILHNNDGESQLLDLGSGWRTSAA